MTEHYAVIDTNAAVSYYLGNKSEAHAAITQLRKYSRLLASEETLAEFQDVMLREKFARIPKALRESFVQNYGQLITIIHLHIDVHDCIDPKDNKFLSLALSGEAKVILTSDRHLLPMNPFCGVDILSPKTYLERADLSAPR